MDGRTSSHILEPEHVLYGLVDKIRKMMKIPPWMNDGLVLVHIPEFVAFCPFIHQQKETHAPSFIFHPLLFIRFGSMLLLLFLHISLFIYLDFWWSSFCVWMTNKRKKHRKYTTFHENPNQHKQCTREYHSSHQSSIPNKTMWVHRMNYNEKWPFQLNYTRKVNIFSNQTQSNFGIRWIYLLLLFLSIHFLLLGGEKKMMKKIYFNF